MIYKSVASLKNGTVVLISLRKRILLGCVFKKVDKPITNFEIKFIKKEYQNKILPQNLLSFHDWISSYNCISLGLTLKLFLPNQKIIEEGYKNVYELNKKNKKKIDIDQQVIVKMLPEGDKTKKEILVKIGNKLSVFNKLLKEEIIIEKKKANELKSLTNLKNLNLKQLSSSQDLAYCKIKEKIINKSIKPVFLDGVTGSGKTEIYFHLIRDFLKKKKQVLVMLPEIALSEQWLNRFKYSFGFYPLVWNSKIRISQKRKIWNAALKSRSLVVVGARSSLFLPYANLGLIIIDEENDQSYKQEEKVIYNARDMAVLKCKIEKSHIILVSATPSLETYQNCVNGKYEWIKIKKRFKGTSLPKIKIIDMRKSKSRMVSEKLELLINKNLNEKKQSLILINRRGYAPVSICSKCGKKKICKYCDASLVYHKENDVLMCHQCGRKEPLNKYRCANCNGNKFILVGVGIEQVYEEVSKIFKNAKIIKLSSDHISKDSFEETLNKIDNNDVDIIVATQIISKGFDFRNLKSVFIVDFDAWFNNADIRTNEKIFQLTQQVAGRAGRREEIGEVYIQTFDPKNKFLHNIINHQRDTFYVKELKIRQKSLLPPFARLLSVTISSKFSSLAREKAKKIKKMFEKSKDLIVLGPIPAQVFYVNKNYRFKLLIKSREPFLIQNFIIDKMTSMNNDSKIKVKLDIDPYNLY